MKKLLALLLAVCFMLPCVGFCEILTAPENLTDQDGSQDYAMAFYRHMGINPELRIDEPIAVDYDTAWELAQVYILSLQRKGLLDEKYQCSLAVYDAEHMIWFFRMRDINEGAFALDGVGYTLALSAQTGELLEFKQDEPV